jgi:hypothetical protein
MVHGPYEEEYTCMSYEEEDTCMGLTPLWFMDHRGVYVEVTESSTNEQHTLWYITLWSI